MTTTAPVVSRVTVDPTVVLSLLDHHTRRGEKQARVIGALYGILRNDVVEIRQTIPITHVEEEGSSTIGTALWDTMAKYNRKIHIAPLIGWYQTGTTAGDMMLDQVFTKACGTTGVCIRLIVDGDLKYGGLRLRILAGLSVTLFDQPTWVHNHVPFTVRPCNAVQASVVNGLLASVCPDAATLDYTTGVTPVHRLRSEVNALLACLDATVAAKTAIPSETVYGIQKALRSLPRLPAELSSQLVDGAIQDAATIEYLAKVVGVQLTLIERLMSMVQL